MDINSAIKPDEVEESLRLEALCLKGHTTALSADGHLYDFLDSQPRIKLSSGFSMPIIGLGTWWVVYKGIRTVLKALTHRVLR